ncbi:MAG: pitrilysin family protein [Planctomycetota bacterium]
MKRSMISVSLVACSLLGVTARGQDVKYEKYKLPNGLTVILHEDHALPVATINTWYGVGAQDEPPGRSGFAHLFEHLMFMGTKRVEGNQFDVLMETGGGANNASTDLHRTNYYSWGPSKLLPTLLWLDADRLEDMGLQMNVDKLNKQRDVVRNELRQNVENAPYAKAGEAVSKLLYTPDHPYYYGVIGTHEDLEAANVTNVKDFFATFYVPGNASLVVAGDFDSKQIKPMVDQLFGTIAAGQPIARKYVKPTEPIPCKMPGIKRFTAIDKVELPKVQFTYHSPVAFGPGDAEMKLAAAVLGDGKASRLYKRLVIDEKLASEVGAAQQGFPLGGIFQVDVNTKPEADLAKVEKIMDEEIARFVKDGPTSEELDRHKAGIELALLSGLQSIERKADRMNEYEFYWGEPNSFKRDLDRYRNASTSNVRSWAGRTFTQGARVIVRVLPEEPERGTSPRDARPGDASAGSFNLPEAVSFDAKCGMKVHVWTRKDLPLVELQLVSQPGGALDKSGQQGLASITADMLGEGTKELDSLAFENQVQTLGGTFGAGADHETLSVGMTILKRNLDKGAGLFASAVRAPRMEAKDWDRVKGLTLDSLKQRLESPPAIAGSVANRLLYGDSNPYAWPAAGTVKTVGSLTLDDARRAHAALLNPARCTLLLAGDVTADEAKALVERHFGEWSSGGAAPALAKVDYAAPAGEAMRVVIVNRPGATQTTIGFVGPGVSYADSSRVSRQLLNTILGGSFTSRLNQNLREDHGYTYGARSRFEMRISGGSFYAGASVKADTTGASLQEFAKEFGRLKAGDVTDAEATKARETLRNDMVRGFQGLGGLIRAAATLLENKLPFETVTTDMAAMSKVTAAELNTLAKAALTQEKGVLILVGDKTVILEQIKDLKLPTPSFYDPEGNPAK